MPLEWREEKKSCQEVQKRFLTKLTPFHDKNTHRARGRKVLLEHDKKSRGPYLHNIHYDKLQLCCLRSVVWDALPSLLFKYALDRASRQEKEKKGTQIGQCRNSLIFIWCNSLWRKSQRIHTPERNYWM